MPPVENSFNNFGFSFNIFERFHLELRIKLHKAISVNIINFKMQLNRVLILEDGCMNDPENKYKILKTPH